VTWKHFWEIFSFANYALVAYAIVIVLRRPREPRAMLAWVLALLLLPVLGLVLFVLIGQLRLERTQRRRARSRRALAHVLARHRHAAEWPQPPPIDAALLNVVHLATKLTTLAPTLDNEVTLFQSPESFFLSLRMAIENARHHVHMEYYIWQPDETGRALAESLRHKARQGVRCRLLLDAIGSWRLTRRLVRELRAAGVEVAFFHPVLPWRGRWHVNFRNHRKLVVVDGQLGFTGSQNIGDEYRGRLRRLAPWRDVNIGIRGPAVLQLQSVFLEDWAFSTRCDIDIEGMLPDPPAAGRHAVHIIPSGPDTRAYVLHQILFAAIAAARRSICIATPYFVPDSAMILALESAALRGVRVRLLIPSRTDHRFVLWAGRSFYQELAESGVETYEYDGGMLHAKTVIIDESWALAGSANMDVRSFRLNFELTTVLYDAGLARTLQAEFDDLISASRRCRPTGRHDWTFAQSLVLGVARMASPML